MGGRTSRRPEEAPTCRSRQRGDDERGLLSSTRGPHRDPPCRWNPTGAASVVAATAASVVAAATRYRRRRRLGCVLRMALEKSPLLTDDEVCVHTAEEREEGDADD
jgi:MYXO-CTERM domain-containing protein